MLFGKTSPQVRSLKLRGRRGESCIWGGLAVRYVAVQLFMQKWDTFMRRWIPLMLQWRLDMLRPSATHYGDVVLIGTRSQSAELREDTCTGIALSQSLMPRDARTNVHTDTVYRNRSTHKHRQAAAAAMHS